MAMKCKNPYKTSKRRFTLKNGNCPKERKDLDTYVGVYDGVNWE